MLELLAFLIMNGPAIYGENSKEYQILDEIDDYEKYSEIEEYLNLTGYNINYEHTSDCWVITEKLT